MSETENALPRPVIDAADARRLGEALAFAAERQGRQVRKGTRIPYVSHLLHVAGLVLEHHGRVDEAIAALLHDVVEDADVTCDELRERFGDTVSAIVAACTDSLAETSVRDHSTWLERKTRYLAHLKDAPRAAVLVSACDKRHNLGALVADVRRDGRDSLRRFNAAPAQLVWFYRSFAQEAAACGVPAPLAAELRELADELARLAGVAE